VLDAHDDFFFHYTKADTAFGAIIPERTLRLSPYNLMGDPFESQEWMIGGAGRVDEDDRLDKEWVERFNLINKAKAETKVLSLSIDADGYQGRLDLFGRGYARASMWQLYAESHTGVCLAFDRDSLIETLRPQLEALGRTYHRPVEYHKGGVTEVDMGADFFMLDAAGGDALRDVERHIEDHHDALLFTKLADWQGEWEYRFVVLGKGDDYVYCSIGNSLRAVILGHRFPPWQGESARKLCEEHGLALYRVHWEHWRPHLLIGPPKVGTPAAT
jgi:Protein of unknown function (DUF2971)